MNVARALGLGLGAYVATGISVLLMQRKEIVSRQSATSPVRIPETALRIAFWPLVATNVSLGGK